MDLAEFMSMRATCDRLHVGCVISMGSHIVSTGYNTSLDDINDNENGRKQFGFYKQTCDSHGHLMVEGHCKRTIHAEVVAITNAAKFGISLNGGTAYITAYPCIDCLKSLGASGIKSIFYKKMYGSKDVAEVTRTLATQNNIRLIEFVDTEETDPRIEFEKERLAQKEMIEKINYGR